MIMRISQLLAVLAMAISLAACGGNTDNTALDMTPAIDSPVAAGQSLDAGAELAAAEREVAWIDGYYVVTAGATYHNGLDYLFQLLTDGNGKYKWVLKITNNFWQPKTIHVGWQQYQYDFRIMRNGVMLWQAFPFNDFVKQYPDITLNPYQTFEYTTDWNGRDLRGRPIQGLVDAVALHFEEDLGNPPIQMSGMAWLNGLVSF